MQKNFLRIYSHIERDSTSLHQIFSDPDHFFAQRDNSGDIMTKLMEWLTALGAFFAAWYALYTQSVAPEFSRRHREAIFWAPFGGVALFGAYCITVIAYRVATFNDCQEAAKELQAQIVEAKADLKRKGLKMD